MKLPKLSLENVQQIREYVGGGRIAGALYDDKLSTGKNKRVLKIKYFSAERQPVITRWLKDMFGGEPIEYTHNGGYVRGPAIRFEYTRVGGLGGPRGTKKARRPHPLAKVAKMYGMSIHRLEVLEESLIEARRKEAVRTKKRK
jgi:hypothetical protein